ncbi:MAG: YiiD C-terminal domain-containing protein [Thermomonas haemolytica]
MDETASRAALDALSRHLQGMPPVAALQPRILGWEAGRLRLGAPLAANVNDKGCAFGGSLASLMTLAAWGLVALELEADGLAAEVFVADCRVRYLKPVFEDLVVEATFEDPAARPALAGQVRAQGRASVRLQAQALLADGAVAATFAGRYVAIAKTAAAAG